MTTPTISHVRRCDPQSMTTFAAHLTRQNTTFTDRVEQMNRDVNSAMATWKGRAATAASARALSRALAGNHLGETVVGLADHFDTYGAELHGYRTALLTIVDNEAVSAGMTVNDDGTVDAPRMPLTNAPLVTVLVQHILDDRAIELQNRIKALLTRFSDTENTATNAITIDLEELIRYRRAPNDPPTGSDAPTIPDDAAPLPADPTALHNLWQQLTPAEKDTLWQHDQYLGNRDGLPVADRDHYNRRKLGDELARARAGDPALAGKLDDLRTVAASVDKPGRYLLHLDTQRGATSHAVVAAGNPDTADNVAVYVPGTGSRPSTMGQDMKRVDAMRRQAVRSGATNTSVIAWFGYDAPQNLMDATQKLYADAASPSLDRFCDGLRASHDGAAPYTTVIGHSYGTTVVGDAAGHGNHLNADSVVFVASPGTTVDHARDISLTAPPPLM